MKTRRDFLKSLVFAVAGLGINNCFPLISNTITSVDGKTLPENFCPSWRRTIFCQFDHYPLKKELEQCAKEIDCDLFFGEPTSSDIIAIPSFVLIIDRNITGDEIWEEYVGFCDEVYADDPCIIVDTRKDLPLPSTNYVAQFDLINSVTILDIIAIIKQRKHMIDLFPPPMLET